MYPWNLTAILIQAFVPDYLVEMFLNTVSFVLVVNIVQRSEEQINPTVGIQSHIAYMSDMKKTFTRIFRQRELLLIWKRRRKNKKQNYA